MTIEYKRTMARGFTLIELLIVVIIVAILAAIAIPQFSTSTTDAQSAAMDANLASVRTALEQYKVQHNSVYPGAVTSTGTCTSGAGANVTGAGGDLATMNAQLQNYTNAAGVACNTQNADFKYGPYLRLGVPSEPVTNSQAVAIITTGAPIVPAPATGGWAYDTKSGQFVMNSNANDTGTPTRKYSAH